MLQGATDQLVTAFATWQTPVSFLAGVGAHHLYCKYLRDPQECEDQERDVQEEG